MPLLLTAILSLCMFCDGHSLTSAELPINTQDVVAYSFGSAEEKIFRQLEKKYQKLTEELGRKRKKLLSSLFSREKMISETLNQGRIVGIDSLYTHFNSSLQGSVGGLNSLNHYLPGMDSLITGVNYLQINSGVQLDPLSKVTKQFQEEWNKTQMVQDFVKERFYQMQVMLTNTPAMQMLKKVQQQIGYYQLQVAKYKQLLSNPDQLLRAALQIAKNQPGFADYMSTNSQLAALFGVGNTNIATPLAGLQTMNGTQQQLTQQIAGAGISNPSHFLTAQLNMGDGLIQAVQNKVNEFGGGEQMGVPDFKPNMQRTKKFLERWIWGINFQSQRPNGWLPTTTDLGLMAGYQFTDKIVSGGGLAYKMGWGKSISNIRFSHEGVGLRLFTDIKLKGSIWISGGYEWNHQAAFSRIRDLSALSSWQRSGLIGLSKKYSIGKKKGSIQLLWDFLSYQQMPQGRALKFRVGYGL